ncbi:unnamed protein product [Prunus armeniaca]|uniref:Uncharacterized protein n=1 Tax=Prunus armeniaca TaxID=36596 RepID=A0A6J5XSR9_PRUAR|nr:unnamed protein product [Prunus armeniaca]
MLFLDQKDAQSVEPAVVRLDETVASPSCSQVTYELEDPARKICSNSSCARVSEDYLEDQQTSLKPEIQNDVEIANNMGESCTLNIKDSFNPVTHEEMSSAEVPVLRACNSVPNHRNMLSPANISEIPGNLPSEVVGPSFLDNATSFDNQFENLDRSATYDLPAPEKLLSVPEGFTSKPSDFLMESTPDKEIIGGDAGDDTGTKLISGKKRSSTESTMTVQSLNSVESFGEARGKRTAESIPDDDDLLSSILVGRRSSVLKMKPTPLAPDIICSKRSRTAVRSTASKRKVLMDDTMVLHGEGQFLEDDIFTVPVLTGMSVELIFLHTETFDLSRTRVSENDQDSASAELLKDVETYARPNSRLMDKKTDDEDALLQMDALCMSPGRKLGRSTHGGGCKYSERELMLLMLLSILLKSEQIFSNDQPVEEIGNNEQHMRNETEVLDANFGCDDKDPKSSCLLGDGRQHCSLNGKESLGSPEADLQSGIEAEVTAEHPAEDFGHFEDVVLGNDTGPTFMRILSHELYT